MAKELDYSEYWDLLTRLFPGGLRDLAQGIGPGPWAGSSGGRIVPMAFQVVYGRLPDGWPPNA